MGIFDGTVAGGTPLQVAQAVSTTSGYPYPASPWVPVTPVAGSFHTYNVGIQAGTGSKTTLGTAGAAQPVTIIVEVD
jgi:hypothetical protein